MNDSRKTEDNAQQNALTGSQKKAQKKAQKKYPKYVRHRAKTPLWLKLPLILVAVLVSIYLLVFVAAPFFALRYVEQWYAEQGEGQSLLIGGWTLSPFTGEVELRDVSAVYPVKDSEAEVGADFIGINVNLSALLDQTIHIQSVGVSGLKFRGKQSEEGLSLAGITLPGSDQAEEATPDNGEVANESGDQESEQASDQTGSSGPLPEGWSLRVDDISLTDDLIQWQQAGLAVTVELSELSTGLFNSATDDATPLTLDVTLRELSVAIGEESLVLRSPVTLRLQAEAQKVLTQPNISGDISLTALALDAPGIEGVEFNALDIKGASFNLGESGMTAGLRSLLLKNVQAQLPDDEKAQLDQLMLSQVSWRASEDDVLIKELSLEGFSGNLAGFPELSLAAFTTSEVRVEGLSTQPVADIGRAALDTLRARHPEAGVLQLGNLTVIGVQANADEQKVSSLELNALSVTPPGEEVPLASLAHYQITDITATPSGFASGVHQFYGLVSNVTRLADGSIKGVPQAEAEATPESGSGTDSSATEDTTDETATEAVPFRVQIAGIQLLTEGDDIPATTFNWTDEAVTPTVNTSGKVLELSTGAIDTEQLESGVDLTLLLALDTYNRIRASGKMGVKGDYPEGKLEVDIDQLNLVDFNPYLVDAMGYRLKKGMLGVDSIISITDGQLGGNVLIKLQNSKFEPADEETIDRLSKQISMPVETALSVLKDDNNNIRIDVPLSGDITQPDVGINDVINQVSRKALRTATLYYLKQSLVPYGQLISIASLAGDQLFAIRLNNLNYEPQQLELNEEHTAYLDTVADMMSKKPELELQACPVAGPQEVEAWGDAWYSEAVKRGAAVKAYLAEKQDKNDKSLSGRVTVCAPQKGDKPEVILGV
ncbi:protein of unknown function [Thalassolituus maritimus]|uniref:DUF748 domain-containing protein n=1 Tax=Thalassolituus maritimus TaxID=484498 RepID=A0A1N7KXZ1_9GAMM|nr:DUF748 domain-containing protein [Thalassolituus maritimus]SIS66502.1 protein of unknown function [Thalassolituus maritimus]